MSKALRTAGTIVAGVALVATGVGALAGAGLLGAGASALAGAAGAWTLAGISVQTLGTIGAGMAFLGDATAKPLKVGGVAGTQVDFAADPNAPIPYVVGRTGTGGRIIYATTGEAKNRNILYNTVLSGGAPIQGFDGFKAAGQGVTFSPLTEAADGGTFNLRMWQRRQLGATPSAALLPPNTTDSAVLGEWTADHKTSGYATAWYVLGYDQKTYASGVPEAVWTIKGALVYDPREDGTYPGGLGLQRINDPASWRYSENPYLHALAWCLGRYANGVRVLGIGAPASALDLAAFVEAANVADANSWRVGGVVYSNDSKWDVLKAMCQAGGGRPVRLGASITVLVNTPRVSVATLTAADLVGSYSVQAAQSVRGRPNQIIPKYRSEAHGWEMVAAGPVKVPAYVTADKRLRSREVSYPLVQDAAQVAQLAAYDLVNGREFGPVTVACKPQWMGYRGGDCITVDVADLGMNGQKALILTRTVDPMTGGVSLTLQSETDAKHDYALGRTGSPPPIPGLTAADPLPSAPTIGSWTAVGTVLAGVGGARIPAIVITGSVDDPNATHLIVEYREVLAGPPYGAWVGNEYPASSVRIEIAGLSSGATYQVRVRYRTIRGLDNAEVSLSLGTVTVGSLGAEAVSLGGRTAAQILNDFDLDVLNLAKEVMVSGTWRGETDTILFLSDGTSIRTVVQQLGVTTEGHTVFITSLQEVDGSGNAKAVMSLNVDGYLSGYEALNDGTNSDFIILSDRFGVVDPGGGSPFYALAYEDGRWRFQGSLKVDSIETDNFQLGSVDLRAILNGELHDTVTAYTNTAINDVSNGTSLLSASFSPRSDNGVQINFFGNVHFPSSRTTAIFQAYRDGVPVGRPARASLDGQDEITMSLIFFDLTAEEGEAYAYDIQKVSGASSGFHFLSGDMIIGAINR